MVNAQSVNLLLVADAVCVPHAVQKTNDCMKGFVEATRMTDPYRTMNRRKRVVIEMPNGKKYLSCTTLNRFFHGIDHSWGGTTFSCEIARCNRIEQINEGDTWRFVVTGTEMSTSFRGFAGKDNHIGDVYSVIGVYCDGETLIVKLGTLLVKARRKLDFTLKTWKPKAGVPLTDPTLRFVG